MRKICILLIVLLNIVSCSDNRNIIEYPQMSETQDSIDEMIEKMSLEEKVAQLFIVRCPETDADKIAKEYQLGGFIMFSRDFKNETPDSIKERINTWQESSRIPMFIGVDEEGGTVNRVSRHSAFRDTPYESPQNVFKAGGMEGIREDSRDKSEFLLDLGINLNFAPVCDISENADDFMYKRAFGKGAEETAEYVGAVVAEMNSSKIGSVLKHFPGYGNNVDTHTGIAYDTRDYDTFKAEDFLPFEKGIKEGASMVLVSHNIVEAFDSALPASLSPNVHRVLREELGFSGVIITDDLAMDAIDEYTENAAVLAIKAGNDMICCTDFKQEILDIIEAVQSGDIAEEEINKSVKRILSLKVQLGIFEA